MSDAQGPDLDWPSHFDEWPKPGQIAFLMLSLQRHELILAIGERAGISTITDRASEMEPSTARLTKEELAELALFIGAQHGTYPDQRDQ